ncbi:hypothetical protein CEP51_010974 [Fusarium floridanum]|uniref:RING-type domain-containing protein n=1 Tax=Fusarium floridanum TaxID=1325733 RepID=A0A428RCS0_9HYPO|nr:hypothetical protein CEP51_010974 [Fusarium floridanum]
MSSDETRESAPESSIVELIDEFLMEEGLVSESPMEEEEPFNESLMEEFINEFLMEEGLIESPMEEDLTNESVIEEGLINESYWPRLREILVEDPSGMDRLNLECMICTMPMVINPHDPGQEDRVIDHRAMILLCGHLVGFSCIYRHFCHRQEIRQPFTCPFHGGEPLCHPDCGCGHMGWPMPSKVEEFSARPLTTAEGLLLARKCIGCTLDDVVRCLTILTDIFVPDLSDLLKSFQVAYRIRVKHLIWGEFEGDERASHEVKLPFSMLQHCRNMESSLITTCSAPGLHLRVGDVKVGLFLYDEPMEHGRVVRRGLRNTALDTGSTVEIHY